jgi:hypothetical protein
MMATQIPDAISAYSIAVAPRASMSIRAGGLRFHL